jgi:hypothetical protein
LCAFPKRVSAKPGETIRITPDTLLVHLFDAGTGLRRRLRSARALRENTVWPNMADGPRRSGPGVWAMTGTG